MNVIKKNKIHALIVVFLRSFKTFIFYFDGEVFLLFLNNKINFFFYFIENDTHKVALDKI
jgi:hypothetical protein